MLALSSSSRLGIGRPGVSIERWAEERDSAAAEAAEGGTAVRIDVRQPQSVLDRISPPRIGSAAFLNTDRFLFSPLCRLSLPVICTLIAPFGLLSFSVSPRRTPICAAGGSSPTRGFVPVIAGPGVGEAATLFDAQNTVGGEAAQHLPAAV